MGKELRRAVFDKGRSASGPSSQSIMADMARRAALPKDHPDYASPDIDVDYDRIVRKAPGVEKPGKKARKK